MLSAGRRHKEALPLTGAFLPLDSWKCALRLCVRHMALAGGWLCAEYLLWNSWIPTWSPLGSLLSVPCDLLISLWDAACCNALAKLLLS